ncbi:MAG: hypothetical protein KJ989_19470 [Gammaproteobacteria bacterium]|nr:hypothetical protein [Gammaproteobacteria bacterium]MBU2253539.1 hypothetical protein [Gammaproteobacteria bacterium]MBU2296379.1 hypothetical protein [Gammaproteobacteria bacterium]
MPSLSHVQLTNDSQIAFGERLGLNLKGKSVGVARAEIDDAIAIEFHGAHDFDSPSAKQCALAKKFGFDISNSTKSVGFAVIDDIMHHLNMEAIEKHQLAPGVTVHNIHQHEKNYVISSISSDGTVYFKGGNGKRAWARNLERL